MKKLFLFVSALLLSATMFASPSALPTAPTVPANQVKAVYSATYSADCNFGDWGSGTVFAQENYGKKFTTTNLGYFGLVDFALNCSKMEALHLDVWFEEAGSFRVVPIHGGAEQGVTVTVGAEDLNKWKSVDIALSDGDFIKVTDWSNVYQIKIDNAANETFWLNNIYFYTSQAPQEDEDAPENFSAEVKSASYSSVEILAYAEDASGEITYSVKESGAVIATANGTSGVEKTFTVTGLESGKEYSLLVLASDPYGNVADGISLSVKTLAAPAGPEAPTYDAENVMSIYSDHYDAVTSFNVGSWGQSTVSEAITLSDGTSAYFLSNANYLGWELNSTIDVKNMKYVTFSVYPLAGTGTAIEFTPIWGSEALKKVEGLKEGEWNVVTISLDDYTGINKENIYQLKWASMPTKMFLTDVLFYAEEPVGPEITTPQVPTVAAANVKAIMCETYENNLGYWPQGWGGCGWVDTCKAGVNFFYAKTMHWDSFASDWEDAFVGDYKNLHFDIWFAEDGNAPIVKLEFNDELPTEEITIPGEYTAGWNSVNINVKEIFGEQPMNSFKCLTVKVTKEGGPVAWANILFFNGEYTSTEATGTCADGPLWPEDAPATAPAAPTVDGASILGAELTTDYAFEPLDWPGAMPELLTFETGENIYFMSKMTWQIYTNWAADYYDVSEYDMLHVDIYPATGTEIKVTFEALGDGEGGSGYKNSVVKALTAGQWNGLDIALSDFPAMNDGGAYDFSDVKYLILEGYNAEQTPMSVGNVYFYSAATGLNDVMNVKAVRKVMQNNHVMIMRNGVRYNLIGTIVK